MLLDTKAILNQFYSVVHEKWNSIMHNIFRKFLVKPNFMQIQLLWKHCKIDTHEWVLIWKIALKIYSNQNVCKLCLHWNKGLLLLWQIKRVEWRGLMDSIIKNDNMETCQNYIIESGLKEKEKEKTISLSPNQWYQSERTDW